jgi:glycosyltransferase involved in cell wall biosynthesis
MKISVVIPAYNAAPWIGRAIQSVVDQTFPVSEIIVVDDGSNDSTADVVATFNGKVKYVRQTNNGPSKARNTGMAASSGEWLAFLDADDWWMPNKLHVQYDALKQRPDAILVYTSLLMVKDTGEVMIRQSAPANQLWPLLRYRNPIAPSSVLVKRSVMQQIGGFNEKHKVAEDWEAWVRMRRIGKFVNVEQPVTCSRVVPTSLSSNGARMFRGCRQMLDSTLVGDLSGMARLIWKRRILAYQAYSAAMTARSANQHTREIGYLLQSLKKWPSPFWYPKRYVALGFSVKRHSRNMRSRILSGRNTNETL